jgi:hypothetical protein
MTMRKGNAATVMVWRGLSGALLADLARCVASDPDLLTIAARTRSGQQAPHPTSHMW